MRIVVIADNKLMADVIARGLDARVDEARVEPAVLPGPQIDTSDVDAVIACAASPTGRWLQLIQHLSQQRLVLLIVPLGKQTARAIRRFRDAGATNLFQEPRSLAELVVELRKFSRQSNS